MARIINQETYDEAVNENIEIFSMSPEEAIEETIKQFNSQGVDLSNIIKDLIITQDHELILTYLDQLRSALAKKHYEKIPHVLDKLSDKLDKDIARRVYAGKRGCYGILLSIMKDCKYDTLILKSALETITSLMTGNPDLLDDKGVSIQMEILDKQEDKLVLQCLLHWIRACCIKHEANRQNIFNADIFNRLKKILTRDDATASEVRDACSVIRALVLDDDIRHEYGKAHEHATVIARGALDVLTGLLSKFKNEKAVMGDLMITLASLIVRNEFCQDVTDAGGLKFVLDIIINYPDSEKLNWQALKLLKALAGNDNVKSHIVTAGGAPLIVSVISRFKKFEGIVVAGLACISALTLRSSSNAGVFYDCGAPRIIIDCMKSYLKNLNVIKQAAWAIRNMSVRNKLECKEFIAYGVEEILNNALKIHGTKGENDIKAALRDLGLKVELKERWTGKGAKLNSETDKRTSCE
ncbi:armadillo repeat-containing protein 6 homolog [Vespa velutina]|uniref:armadillo repeat-containing protein 6 homolog n=1 Tax=Vespa velutina TaxID=202808 RepID=UPI001FB35F99|nr:armadillo repeat-containing protein 6 homolog [Vespa velutina]